MDAFDHLLNGFSVATQPLNLAYVFLGCLLGTVIGVLPTSSSVFEAEARLWVPLPVDELKQGNREDRNYVAFGLLKPEVSQQQAQAEMTVISQNLARQYQENDQWEIAVEPMIG